MRADRLLSLVLLLRARGRMTATELADELEVSVRTVLRDIEALSSAGIPVYAERGRYGGFALLPGFSTDLTGLTPDEAVALLTARSAATSQALGLGSAFASAMRKVIAALPAHSRDEAHGAADRILVRPGGWLSDAEPDPELAATLAVVRRAVFAGHRLRIQYQPSGERPAWRTVDPLGLVSAGHRWYLLARRDGAARTYRVSRIRAAKELAEPARRPDGIDLAELWNQHRAEFRAQRARLTVRARVRADQRERLARAALAIGAPAEADDWLTVTVEFADQRHAEQMLWSLAPQVEVLEPIELRAVMARRARQVASCHGD